MNPSPKSTITTSVEFQGALGDLLYGIDDTLLDVVVCYRTFAEEIADDGIRYNSGIAVLLNNGTEYQITIVRSK